METKRKRPLDRLEASKLKSYLVRCNAETPPFFKKLRTVGVVVAAAGTALVTAPVALPAAVLAIGGYLIVGGAVASAVSQAAIADAHADCDDELPLDKARGNNK